MSLRPLQRKFVFLIIRCLLLVFFALGVKVWADDSNSQTSVITIVNANKTEYVKDSVTKEEQIVLTGAVVVEVAQGSVKRIQDKLQPRDQYPICLGRRCYGADWR